MEQTGGRTLQDDGTEGGARAAFPVTAPRRLRIGQVCDLLRPEFPDISISKLRFLEDQGLVRPLRTSGGYRMYSAEHVRELRHILAMQRDEFLPLRVIRDELRRRLGTPASGGASPSSVQLDVDGDAELVDARELCVRANVTPELLRECMEFDLVSGQPGDDGSKRFTAAEQKVVAAAGQLFRLGFEIRNLRQVRSAAARQAALIEQFAAPRLRARNPEQRAAAARGVELASDLVLELIRHAFVSDVEAMTARAHPAAAGVHPATTLSGSPTR